MEALICLSVFIVLSSIWAFLKTKKRVPDRPSDLYYLDDEQGYEDDSE